MKVFKRLLCFLRGHKPEWYERNGIFYQRCKCCKQPIDIRHDINPFGW